jgi:hypothetical protein
LSATLPTFTRTPEGPARDVRLAIWLWGACLIGFYVGLIFLLLGGGDIRSAFNQPLVQLFACVATLSGVYAVLTPRLRYQRRQRARAHAYANILNTLTDVLLNPEEPDGPRVAAAHSLAMLHTEEAARVLRQALSEAAYGHQVPDGSPLWVEPNPAVHDAAVKALILMYGVPRVVMDRLRAVARIPDNADPTSGLLARHALEVAGKINRIARGEAALSRLRNGHVHDFGDVEVVLEAYQRFGDDDNWSAHLDAELLKPEDGVVASGRGGRA